MSLAPGTRLGPYEITAAIGAGGMGEVYRARDSKLDRDVAIKVLPESFALDADRVARFAREAKTLASLNHPNIAAIYAVETTSGVVSAARGSGSTPDIVLTALVMELVDGEDLSAHIARGPIALVDALPIAKQIADALEAAHELGIVHRDLKPQNIKVRADGTVKVLDFGLAKAMDPAGASGANVANSPTMTANATAMGMIIGTAAYMAPEQARGRHVDRRADIWAFGVVLYEMLSGTRAFDGEDISITLASVLKDDVKWDALPRDLPASLQMLLRRCLEKDPKRRLSWIGEARHTLDAPSAIASRASSPVAASQGRARWLWPGVAALGVVATIVMSALYLTRPQPQPAPSVTFEVAAPDLSPVSAISPDGRQLIFRTAKGADKQTWQLWLRSFSSLDARPVPGTQGVSGAPDPSLPALVWSPDSRSAVFVGPAGLMRVDVNTGQTAELSKGAPGFVQVPGAWGRDGVILYGRRSGLEIHGSGIWRVAETGGTPVQLTELRSGETFHAPSGFLPDGHHFIYFVLKGNNLSSGEVRIGSIDAAPAAQGPDTLLRADGAAVYSAGFLLFVSQGSLMAQPFDAARNVLTGVPALIASGVAPTVSASAAGDLVYRGQSDAGSAASELTRFSRTGKVIGKIGAPASYGEVMAMPDGRRIVVSRTDPGESAHLQVVDLARAVFSRLSPGTASDYGPAVSPNGTVAYTYSPEGLSRDIYVRAANGVGEPRRLVTSDTVKHPNGWSPDGRFLIYDDHVSGHLQDLAVVRQEGGAPIPFLATEADETFGQFSPDGKWIAYRSTESGRPEVYVRDFAPDRSPAYGTEKIPISVNGGDKPRWNPNGREIYFFQGNSLMAAPVRPGKPFDVGTPTRLFEAITTGYVPYDVMPDGTFVVNVLVQSGAASSPLKVLLNWQSALRKEPK